MSPASKRVFSELQKQRLLLLTDSSLPNVCALVVGETVRGSWWAHPRSHEIFRVSRDLADHPDVLVTKLISGKVTFIHRSLWPAVVAVGRSRAPWQMDRLTPAARKLLDEVDRQPVEPGRDISKAVSELEASLLVYCEQIHTESGAHARRLESWDHWASRIGEIGEPIPADRAALLLEEVVESLNRTFDGRGRLPWVFNLAPRRSSFSPHRRTRGPRRAS